MNDTIQSELEKVQKRLTDDALTDKQYCELYAVQQALSWAHDPESAAAPLEIVMSGKIQPPVREEIEFMDTQVIGSTSNG